MNTQNITDWQGRSGQLILKGLVVRRPGPNVIALHGFLDNANSMLALNEAFPKHNFIALDLAGHGKSGHRPAGAHYNQLDYVLDLHQLVISLETHKVILVGHSLGGIIASIYASIFPENVAAVVSIDAFGPLTQSEDTTCKQIRDSILSRVAKSTSSAKREVDLSHAATARARQTDLHEHYCEFILSRNIDIGADGKSYWASDPALRTKSLLRMTSQQAKEIMTQIQCPFLVIAAKTSFKQLESVFNERRHWVSQAKVVFLEGGHHIHLEQHDACVNAIKDFVSEL